MYWKSDELEYLTMAYKDRVPAERIAFALDRPISAVYTKAYRLGLASKHEQWPRGSLAYAIELLTTVGHNKRSTVKLVMSRYGIRHRRAMDIVNAALSKRYAS